MTRAKSVSSALTECRPGPVQTCDPRAQPHICSSSTLGAYKHKIKELDRMYERKELDKDDGGGLGDLYARDYTKLTEHRSKIKLKIRIKCRSLQ